MFEGQDFAASVERLSNAAWAYAALATALEVGLIEQLAEPTDAGQLARSSGVDPDVIEDTLEVLEALGAIRRSEGRIFPTPSFELFTSPSMAAVLQAEVRSDHLQTGDLIARAREGRIVNGWRHEDPAALVAQGETGRLFGLLAETVLPGLDGVAERLGRPDARFLDVGAGVGVIASEICRVYPEVSAVGLEPHETARRIGRERIAAAGLEERIELRGERIEELSERDSYDLAFLPQPFLPRTAVSAGLERIAAALRPGGWLIVLTLHLPDDDPLTSAARRFRARVWGGGAPDPAEVAAELQLGGFGPPRLDPPVGSFQTICARAAVGAAAAVDPAASPTPAAHEAVEPG
jgi:predicted O-methyltransferase YrrM